MAIFIGMRAVKALNDDGSATIWKKGGSIKHFNPEFIKLVDEKTMLIEMSDGTMYRVDEESLQIFLSAMYGEHAIRGDRLDEE